MAIRQSREVRCPSCEKQSAMVQRVVTDEWLMACCGYVMYWEEAETLLDVASDKRRAHADTEPQPAAEQLHALQEQERRLYPLITVDVADSPITLRLKADPTVPPGEIRFVQTDPLDVEYDDWTLRELIAMDEKRRNSDNVIAAVTCSCFTPAQRAALSAHWSAELRKRVDAAKQAEREQVVSEYDDDRP